MKLSIKELVVYTPTEDFEVSQKFYAALGFTLTEGWGGTFDCELGGAKLRLQNYYVKDRAENFMMKFWVESGDEWHEHIKAVFEANTNSMAELKNNLLGDQYDAFTTAILGPDEDVTDELAGEVLAFYGIEELDLIESFKSSISEKLGGLPVEDDRARRLGGMLRNVRDCQKDISGAKLSPKDRISQIFGGIFTPPLAASYAFRGKDEGGLSDSDQAILDELKKELLDESRDDNE